MPIHPHTLRHTFVTLSLDAGAAWDAEISRRVAALEAGVTRTDPWSDIKPRIERENGGAGEGGKHGRALDDFGRLR